MRAFEVSIYVFPECLVFGFCAWLLSPPMVQEDFCIHLEKNKKFNCDIVNSPISRLSKVLDPSAKLMPTLIGLSSFGIF